MAKKLGVEDATRYAQQILENREKFSEQVINLAERYLYFRDLTTRHVLMAELKD